MARVFLSYDREDAERARPVALAIERAGYSVWWDRHIKGGAQYSKAIDEALKESDAVVVLWSERSVESAWVRDEAAAGRDSGRLVPITLDETEPPLGFRLRGREDEAFETLVSLPLGRVDQFLLQTLFRPTSKRLRQDPRFLRIAQHFGLLDFWRQIGQWPDFCSEPGLPYDCKKEAARLSA